MDIKHCSFVSFVIIIIKTCCFVNKTRIKVRVRCKYKMSLYYTIIIELNRIYVESVFSNEYHDFEQILKYIFNWFVLAYSY